VLRIDHITKRFGHHEALQDVSATFASGTVTTILGANGAGKTTLMRILAGEQRPDEGSMVLGDRTYAPRNPGAAIAAGIIAVSQELSLIDDWRVHEHFRNIQSQGFVNSPVEIARARASFKTLNVDIDPREYVRNLSPYECQVVEIARVLASNAQIVLFDEPTANLDEEARAAVFAKLRSLAHSGRAVVLVTHDLEGAVSCSDYLILLADGHVAGQGPPSEWSISRITDVLYPENVKITFPDAKAPEGPPLVTFGWTDAKGSAVDFAVRRGEVIGLMGSARSGAPELLRRAIGLDRGRRLRVSIGDRNLKLSARSLFRHGAVYVSRERNTEWNFRGLSLSRNITAAILPRLTSNGFVSARIENGMAELLRSRFNVVAKRLDQPIESLSGGNRQKVVFARAAATEPAILLVDEPFSGVDIAARAKLTEEMRKLAHSGAAIIIYSQELRELAEASTRLVKLEETGAISTGTERLR
jgi:ABC-type sugar transport system ATPase subunit